MAAKDRSNLKWIDAAEADKLGIDDASKAIKRLAESQRVRITLTPEQMRALRSQWGGLHNGKPAEITFEVDGQVSAKLRVAAYGYFTDVCCA